MKTMSNKMTINTYYQQFNLKIKPEEQRQNYGFGEQFDGCQKGWDCRGMGEEVRGLRSTNR